MHLTVFYANARDCKLENSLPVCLIPSLPLHAQVMENRGIEPEVWRNRRGGFTLVEMLVVLGIMAILAALMVTAMNSVGDAGNFASEVSDFQQLMDDARAYAMANNTYVFVGIEEVDSSLSTYAVPQHQYGGSGTGGGRIAVAVVATKDGTNYTSTTGLTSVNNLLAINKLKIFSNAHLIDYSMNGPSGITPTTGQLANRVKLTGNSESLSYDIDPGGNGQYSTPAFFWPLTATSAATAQYNFYQGEVIQYGPDGSAVLIGPAAVTTLPAPTWIEIDFEQMHGSVVTSTTVPVYTTAAALVKGSRGHQVAAIQIDGITGNSQFYRQ